MQDINKEGEINYGKIVKTDLPGKRKPAWLTSGDIIFLARGKYNTAICIKKDLGKVVCSPHFYIIKILDINQTIPEFLSWWLNLEQSQQYFTNSTEGAKTLSIRRPILDSLIVQLPPIAEQKKITSLTNLIKQEQQIFNELITTRQQQLQLIVQNLTHPNK